MGNTGVHRMCHPIFTAHITVSDCHKHIFIDGEIMFIQKKSGLWAYVALRMSPPKFFTWILWSFLKPLCLHLPGFSCLSQWVRLQPPRPLILQSKERGKQNTPHQSHLICTQCKDSNKHNPEDLYLSKASTLVTMPRVWRVGASATVYPSHDLISAFGVEVPPELKADAMVLSCNAYI